MKTDARNLRISLYVAGDAPSSRTARRVLKELIDGNGEDPSLEWEVVDVLREPARALAAGLLATPTLIIEEPQRSHRFVGDLAGRDDLEQLLEAFRRELRDEKR